MNLVPKFIGDDNIGSDFNVMLRSNFFEYNDTSQLIYDIFNTTYCG